MKKSKNNFTHFFIFAALLVIVVFPRVAYPQRSVRIKSAIAAPPKTDNYWSAQRNIETAVTALEAFISNPSSDPKRVAAAREQLAMLREVRIVPAKNEFVFLKEKYDAVHQTIEWRVTAAVQQPDKTQVSIEIHNTNEAEQVCFQSLAQNHLILTDNKGQVTPMLAIATPSEIIKSKLYSTDLWCLRGSQRIFTTADFAPLAPGVTSFQINYSDRDFNTGTNTSQPAKFSIFKQSYGN